MRISGHSGYTLERVGDLLYKSYSGACTKRTRLRAQAEKQMAFHDPAIRTPRVVSVYSTPELYRFGMEYIDSGLLFDDPEYDRHLDKVLDFVERMVAMSRFEAVPRDLLTGKVHTVRNAIEGSVFADPVFSDTAARLEYLFATHEVKIPRGYCHGDLTFCNVLCTDADVYFVDFLDSFLNSPLLDMVKLRQDTSHGWVNLFTPIAQETLDEVDSILSDVFSRHGFYRDWGPAFDALNLLRIVPYTTDPTVAATLKDEIEVCRRSF